jgi:hypothetical protein
MNTPEQCWPEVPDLSGGAKEQYDAARDAAMAVLAHDDFVEALGGKRHEFMTRISGVYNLGHEPANGGPRDMIAITIWQR